MPSDCNDVSCEKGGAHLKISFWYLLMNLKNKKNCLKWVNKKTKHLEISLFYICLPKISMT